MPHKFIVLRRLRHLMVIYREKRLVLVPALIRIWPKAGKHRDMLTDVYRLCYSNNKSSRARNKWQPMSVATCGVLCAALYRAPVSLKAVR